MTRHDNIILIFVITILGLIFSKGLAGLILLGLCIYWFIFGTHD